MLDKVKQFKWLIVLSLFLLAIPLYFTYNHFQQSSALKEAFEKNERIEVLHRLTASENIRLTSARQDILFLLTELFDWMELFIH